MNAELRRHAWQELRLHELLVTPVVLGVLAITAVAASDSPAETLAWGAMAVFVVLTIGWGTLRAFASVADEVRDRTWDFQRMTALAPAHMALGKVFGAPLLQWYIGAWCLLAFAVAAPRAGLGHVIATMVALVGTAVLLHALGVTASIASARAPLGGRGRRAGGFVLLVLVANVLPFAALLGRGRDSADTGLVWWGVTLAEHVFLAGSAVAFAAWAMLWACRAMGRELREPARYGASAAFALFFGVWVAGRHGSQPARALVEGLAAASAALTLAVYAGVVTDPLTRVSLARARRASSRLARVPGWAIDACAAVVLGLAAYAVASASGVASQPGWRLFTDPVLAAASALMAVRDAAIVACFSLSPRMRRPVGRAMFYIALADVLLPIVFLATKNLALARLAMPLLAFAFPGANPVLLMALHAAVAVGVLAVRVRRAHGLQKCNHSSSISPSR